MQNTLGRAESAARRIAIVVARFNEAVTAPLLAGARDALRARGVRDEDVEVVHVPGAFEIPFAARLVAERGVVDGVVCLGAVIRGETPHFEYVAAVAAQGVARAAEATRVPMSFGVLTTDTVEQALARAGGAVGNKGYEAAITVLEMVALAQRFRGRAGSAEG